MNGPASLRSRLRAILAVVIAVAGASPAGRAAAQAPASATVPATATATAPATATATATATAAAPATAPSPQGESLVILYSPALERLAKHDLGPSFAKETSIRVDAQPQPKPGELQLRTSDGRPADLLLIDDVALLNARLTPEQAPHFTVFATDSMVVAYRPESTFGKAIEAGRDWLAALEAGGVRMVRTDPALDPLGRRTAFVLHLAGIYYGNDKLESRVLQAAQIVPPEQITSRLQRGEADVAILERSRAVAANLAVLGLPIEIDLSDPGRDGVYAQAVVEVGGKRLRGAPLGLAAVPLPGAAHSAAALRFTDFVGATPGRRVLDRDGYLFPPGFPLRRAFGQEP